MARLHIALWVVHLWPASQWTVTGLGLEIEAWGRHVTCLVKVLSVNRSVEYAKWKTSVIWRATGRPVVWIGAGYIECFLWSFVCCDFCPPEALCVQRCCSVRATVECRMFELLCSEDCNASFASDQLLLWRRPNFESPCICKGEAENLINL